MTTEQDHCNYFSYQDHIKLTWPAARQFCQCLGGARSGGLVRLVGDGQLSALSFYTLGLVAGTASTRPQQPHSGRSKVQNCHNYLLCLQDYQVTDLTPGRSGRAFTGEIIILSRLRNGFLLLLLSYNDQRRVRR